MLQFLSLKYTKSIQHIASLLTLHTAHYILYIIYTHSTGEVSRVALHSSFSPVCSSTESSGSGPSHDQATVNSSVSEADVQVVSLLSKLRAPWPSSLAILSRGAYASKTSRLFPFYALRFYVSIMPEIMLA